MTTSTLEQQPATIEELFAEVASPDPLLLDISELPKGINNYHIDVKLSNRFTKDLKALIDELLRHEASLNRPGGERDREKILNPLRQSYQDMMTVLIHRVKTDLSATEVNFLQFGVPKYILLSTKAALNELINKTKLRSSELRAHGSGEVLKVHQHLAWLSKHYNSILYAINKSVFDQLHRVELRQLQSLRLQYLQDSSLDYMEFLRNPLLLNRDLNSPRFLIEHYVYWGGNLEESEFPRLNAELEELLRGHLPECETIELKTAPSDPPEPTEVYDELGGLHAIRPYMGPAPDSKTRLEERFCWLDFPPNTKEMFDLEQFEDRLAEIRREQGAKAAKDYQLQLRRVSRLVKEICRHLRKRELLKLYAASYQVRNIHGQSVSREIDTKLLCHFLSGQINLKKLQDPSLGGRLLNDEEQRTLKQVLREVDKRCKKQSDALVADLLHDLARFRLHLKYFRFAHRLFNRMSILTSSDDIQLSRQARTLYQLPVAAEIEEEEAKIVHHAILKADVRGSTTVTEQLEKKGLNPASHFSLHFFNPINEILPVFGAGKVFIEGDAIILSFLEHEHNPQQWYAVARACGLARSMLQIIHSNNKHARQVGLPTLELGIGICYSPEGPRFLFDGDQPIMISSAIGLADRMSSCSWKLRQNMEKGLFNVDVLEIAEGERERGEKGQQYMRYNVNGILLEDGAFAKLRTEVHLRRVNARIDGEQVTLYSGEYLDAQDRKKSLVIREGRVGLWQNEHITPGGPDSRPYYEVVTSGRIITQLYNAQTASGSGPAAVGQ